MTDPKPLPAPETCCHHCRRSFGVCAWDARFQRMLLCPDCGNKRCPKASDHRLACTGSNDMDQPGSIFRTPGVVARSLSARPSRTPGDPT